jgi:hypothetical protein
MGVVGRVTARAAVRWCIVAVLIVHGLLHLIGAPSPLWLAASLLVVTSAVLLAVRPRVWWRVGLLAAIVSQVAIITDWREAWAGTVANVVLLAAALHGAAAEGPWSLRQRYRTIAASTACAPSPGVLTEAHLAGLPAPVARLVRRTGAVGLPIRTGFRAVIRGRIRAGADAPWMRFTGEQVNTFAPLLTRAFCIDATMRGLPADVLHRDIDGTATMDVRAMSLLPITHADGPRMDRSEAVTMFNDLCVMAPDALLIAPVTWNPIDDHRARGTFTVAGHEVTAELVVDDDGDLVDFVSDDRSRASADGRTFTSQRWSTPLHDRRRFGVRRLPSRGEAVWHAPAPEGTFAYLEFELVELHDLEAADAVSHPASLHSGGLAPDGSRNHPVTRR